MKQVLLVAASLALLWGCSQSTPSTEVTQTEQSSSEDSAIPEGTEEVVLNVPGIS